MKAPKRDFKSERKCKYTSPQVDLVPCELIDILTISPGDGNIDENQGEWDIL